MTEVKFFQIAHTLNNEYREALLEQKLHFRGNLYSFSLISLAKKTAERGFSGLQSAAIGRKRLEIAQQEIKEPNRLTKEKMLQAWLIDNALRNDHRLYFDPRIQFLTSELSLLYVYGTKTKVTNDILGIDEQQNLVIIELKSRREKKKLIDQVNTFEKAVHKNTDTIKAIIEVFQKTWSGGIRKMVVWPHHAKLQTSWPPEIEAYEYQEVESGGVPYVFYGNRVEI